MQLKKINRNELQLCFFDFFYIPFLSIGICVDGGINPVEFFLFGLSGSHGIGGIIAGAR